MRRGQLLRTPPDPPAGALRSLSPEAGRTAPREKTASQAGAAPHLAVTVDGPPAGRVRRRERLLIPPCLARCRGIDCGRRRGGGGGGGGSGGQDERAGAKAYSTRALRAPTVAGARWCALPGRRYRAGGRAAPVARAGFRGARAPQPTPRGVGAVGVLSRLVGAARAPGGGVW